MLVNGSITSVAFTMVELSLVMDVGMATGADAVLEASLGASRDLVLLAFLPRPFPVGLKHAARSDFLVGVISKRRVLSLVVDVK